MKFWNKRNLHQMNSNSCLYGETKQAVILRCGKRRWSGIRCQSKGIKTCFRDLLAQFRWFKANHFFLTLTILCTHRKVREHRPEEHGRWNHTDLPPNQNDPQSHHDPQSIISPTLFLHMLIFLLHLSPLHLSSSDLLSIYFFIIYLSSSASPEHKFYISKKLILFTANPQYLEQYLKHSEYVIKIVMFE